MNHEAEVSSVHGKATKTVNTINLSLPTRAAFHLTFWPSLAFVLVALIAKWVVA